MPRNNPLVVAVLAAALAVGCRRPAPPADSSTGATPVLTPPQSSSLRPLDGDATEYTNEQQAENLRTQAAELGIRNLGKPSANGSDIEEERPPISYDEGLRRTREYAAEFEAERHAIENGKPKSVTLPGTTPEILPARKEGAPLDSKNPDNDE